ncbi:hypothetical protein [Rhodopila sp.]|jgi:surface antigen|uniref:hypothetical protein n=1 Tax=Rhodopila sp. TaxID=2480087 RepID=UPI002BDC3643|nr:hypothetical protein [Rhodopila sp.]HVZ09412.1 hypothetical protein [Rhodopila sp.]
MPCLTRSTGALAACALLAAAWLLAPGAAQAQINPFRSCRGPVLSQADRAAGREAAERLLAQPSPEVGASETWQGPTSGNGGSFTVERLFQQNGHDCRAVRASVHFKQGRERSFVLNACKVDDRWRIAS